MKNFDQFNQQSKIEAEIKYLKRELITSVNNEILHKVTPLYNLYLLACAIVFGYFSVYEGNQCYAKDREAWAVKYEFTEDVTHEFYLISNLGLVIMSVSVVIYYV